MRISTRLATITALLTGPALLLGTAPAAQALSAAAAPATVSSAASSTSPAPDVTSLVARETQTTSMSGYVPVTVEVSVPDDTTYVKVEGFLVVDGVDKGWVTASFGSTPAAWSKGEIWWKADQHGAGEAQLVRSRVTYEDAEGDMHTVEDSTGSNAFEVLQESRMSGSVYRKKAKLTFAINVEHYSVKEKGFVDPTQRKVLLERLVGTEWTKVTTIKLDANGSGLKTIKAKKKADYRLTWIGDDKTAPAVLQRSAV